MGGGGCGRWSLVAVGVGSGSRFRFCSGLGFGDYSFVVGFDFVVAWVF